MSVTASPHQLIKIVLVECPRVPSSGHFFSLSTLRFTHWLYCVGPRDFLAAVRQRYPVAHLCLQTTWLSSSGVLPTFIALLALSQRAFLKWQQVWINPAWHIQPHSKFSIGIRCSHCWIYCASFRPDCYSWATLDSNLCFRHHVSKVCRSAHFHLRALCHIQPVLTDDIWLKQWLFHLFDLASTMLTLSFMDPSTSEGCSVYRTQLPGWY